MNTNVHTFFLINKIIQALFRGMISNHGEKLNLRMLITQGTSSHNLIMMKFNCPKHNTCL